MPQSNFIRNLITCLYLGTFSSGLIGAPVIATLSSQDANPNIKVITVTTDVKGIALHARKVGDQIFTSIYWKDESHTAPVGAPDLPRVNRWFAAPFGSEFKLEIKRSKPLSISNLTLTPKQLDVIDDGRKAPFAFDANAYRRPAGLPTVKFAEGESAAIGPLQLHLISISPFVYDPKSRLLLIYETVTVRVIQTAKVSSKEVALSAQQSLLLKRTALNGGDFSSNTRPGSSGKVLVITTADLESESARLKTIHKSKTFGIKIVTPTTTPEQIKSEITAEYERGNLEAVIIVGDETKVKYYTWNGLPSDSWYSYVAGNDSLSDLSLGRIPAADASEAKLMFDKIVQYQETQESGFATNRVMLAAHAEEYPGKYTANMESVRKAPNPLGLDFNLQYGGKDATNDSVLSRIKDGFAIVNYRGHGSASTWSGWGRDTKSFGSTQVGSMENLGSGLTMVFNIACDTGAFQLPQKSLSEQMLLLPAATASGVESHRGAVTVLAATKPSYTDINNRFSVNLFDFIQKIPDATVGELSLLANNKLVTDANGSMNDNTRMYVLLGDPLLRPSLGSK